MREELGVPVLGRGALSPWDVGLSGSVYFSPLKQAVASSEPNFWTHSLQIHCCFSFFPPLSWVISVVIYPSLSFILLLHLSVIHAYPQVHVPSAILFGTL